MSSQINRTARSLIFYASKHKHLVLSKGRTAAAAAFPLKGRVAALASFNESTNTNKWITGALRFRRQMERTFIAIKPDGVQRGLIIEMLERKGFKLVAMKFGVPSKNLAERHYHDLKERPFFDDLCNVLSSGPVVAMVWEGEGVITYGRKLIGSTDPQQSQPGTIRDDLSIIVGRNIIHGSDGPEAAKKEISIWFNSWDMTNYTNNQEKRNYGIK